MLAIALFLIGSPLSTRGRQLSLTDIRPSPAQIPILADSVRTRSMDTNRQAKSQETKDGLKPPEVVRLEEVQTEEDGKEIIVSNSNNRYHLACNAKLKSCLTPASGKDYWLFSKTTRWQPQGAKECCMTLKFLQDYSDSYNNQENIALFPVDDDGTMFGIYMLVSSAPASPKTAREYFDELKAANAFNHIRDEYVCFDEDNSEPFFAVLARARDVGRMLKQVGDTAGAKRLEKSDFANGLFVQMYNRGIGAGEQIYDSLSAEGTDFVDVFNSPFNGKMTYSINWDTGRYRRAVYDTDHSKDVPALRFNGKCELIHPDVPIPSR